MTATATAYRPRVGDRVVVDPNGIGVSPSTLGRVYVVSKVNPKNVKCTATDGGRGLNYPADLLVPAPEGAPTATATATPVPVPTFTWHEAGTVVTCDRDLESWKAGTPLVVWKCDGEKSNVTLLGGAARGCYYRVPVARLTVRDTAWLTEYLVDHA